jgi:hypothetical protein
VKAIIRVVALILLLPIAAHAGEAERRAFFEPAFWNSRPPTPSR